MDYQTLEHKAILLGYKMDDPPLSDESRYHYTDLDIITCGLDNKPDSSQANLDEDLAKRFLLQPKEDQQTQLEVTENAEQTETMENSEKAEQREQINKTFITSQGVQENEPEAEDLLLVQPESPKVSLMPCHRNAVNHKKFRSGLADSSREITPRSIDRPRGPSFPRPENSRSSLNSIKRNSLRSMIPLATERTPSNLIPRNLDETIARYIINDQNRKLFEDEVPLTSWDSGASPDAGKGFFVTEIEDAPIKQVKSRPPLYFPKRSEPGKREYYEHTRSVSSSTDSKQKNNESYVKNRSAKNVLKTIKENAKSKISTNINQAKQYARMDKQRLLERKKVAEEQAKKGPMRYNLRKDDYSRNSQSRSPISMPSKGSNSRSPISISRSPISRSPISRSPNIPTNQNRTRERPSQVNAIPKLNYSVNNPVRKPASTSRNTSNSSKGSRNLSTERSIALSTPEGRIPALRKYEAPRARPGLRTQNRSPIGVVPNKFEKRFSPPHLRGKQDRSRREMGQGRALTERNTESKSMHNPNVIVMNQQFTPIRARASNSYMQPLLRGRADKLRESANQ